jgi:hypothetical protein
MHVRDVSGVPVCIERWPAAMGRKLFLLATRNASCDRASKVLVSLFSHLNLLSADVTVAHLNPRTMPLVHAAFVHVLWN